MNLRQSDIDRFWKYVDKRDPVQCWPWVGSTRTFGYGQLNVHGTPERAHRISYLLALGSLPKTSLVCHKCDNPPCVNPNHLFLGTHKDNSDDKWRKGRAAMNGGQQGEENGFSRLITEQVCTIIQMKRSGSSHSQIARRFGVGLGTIKDIIAGRTWNHVTGLPKWKSPNKENQK